MKRMFNPFRKAAVVIRDREIVPGVDKPTIILVEMLVAEMLKTPENIQSGNWSGIYDDGIRFRSDRLSVEQKCDKWSFRSTTSPDRWYEPTTGYVDMNGKSVHIEGKKEKELLWHGLLKVRSLRDKAIEINKEAKRQNDALSMIESFFKKEEKDV